MGVLFSVSRISSAPHSTLPPSATSPAARGAAGSAFSSCLALLSFLPFRPRRPAPRPSSSAPCSGLASPGLGRRHRRCVTVKRSLEKVVLTMRCPPLVTIDAHVSGRVAPAVNSRCCPLEKRMGSMCREAGTCARRAYNVSPVALRQRLRATGCTHAKASTACRHPPSASPSAGARAAPRRLAPPPAFSG